MAIKQFKLGCWDCWYRFVQTRGLLFYLLHSKIFNIGHLQIYLLQTWSDDIYCYTLHFDTSTFLKGTSQSDLDLDSRSQGCKKANTSVAIISQSFSSIWMEFGIVLRLVGVVNLILILFYFCPFSIQGREPYLCDFIRKPLALADMQTFTDQFLSNLICWWRPLSSAFDISLDDLDLHSRSQLYEKSNTLVSIF